MKKQIPPKEAFPNGKKYLENPEVEDPNQLELRLIKAPEDKIYESMSDKMFDDAKLKIELVNSSTISIFDKWQEQKKLISLFKIDYKPRFRAFLDLCGDLENFTDEQRNTYRKPIVVPKTIKAIFYSRFPKEAWEHLDHINPLGRGFIRKHKLYYFFDKGGILILEKFIDEAEELMKEVKEKGLGGLYEFRVLHSERFGTGYQIELFRKYIDSI